MGAMKQLLMDVADSLNVDPYDEDGNLDPRVAAEADQRMGVKAERRIQHPAEIALGLAFLANERTVDDGREQSSTKEDSKRSRVSVRP